MHERLQSSELLVPSKYGLARKIVKTYFARSTSFAGGGDAVITKGDVLCPRPRHGLGSDWPG